MTSVGGYRYSFHLCWLKVTTNSWKIRLKVGYSPEEEDLFVEYERFRAIGNESIHDYFVRFHKLVNDMKITQLNIPTHQ
ncbi:hypothetical protein Tco_0661903 [Tanacetum coccineum]